MNSFLMRLMKASARWKAAATMANSPAPSRMLAAFSSLSAFAVVVSKLGVCSSNCHQDSTISIPEENRKTKAMLSHVICCGRKYETDGKLVLLVNVYILVVVSLNISISVLPSDHYPYPFLCRNNIHCKRKKSHKYEKLQSLLDEFTV